MSPGLNIDGDVGVLRSCIFDSLGTGMFLDMSMCLSSPRFYVHGPQNQYKLQGICGILVTM